MSLYQSDNNYHANLLQAYWLILIPYSEIHFRFISYPLRDNQHGSNLYTLFLLLVFDNAYLLFVFLVVVFPLFRLEQRKMLNGRANTIVTIGNILSKKGD